MGNAASADAQRLPLTEDILRVILEQIPREDLKSASLVNRDLAAVSRSFILRQFVLNLAHEDECQRRLDTLRLSTSVSQYVKELSIVGDLAHKRWWQYLAEVEDGPVTMQVQALEELQQHIQNGIFKAGLKRVRWDAGLDMPVALIEAIQVAFPECSFVLEKYAGSALPPMPTLVSLTATVHCHGDPLLNFQPILRHATGLRTLQISAYNHTGCVVRGYTEAEFAALPKPFLTYDPSQPVCGGSGPMLQDLVLERFSWSVEGAVSCLEQMSWSHLRKLELRRRDSVPLLQACVPVSSNMPFLEEFVYTTWYGSEETRADITQALQDFLSSTSGLQVLHVEGPHHPLVSTIVAHHGETLRSLVLHDHERRDEPQRTTLTLGGLRRLGEKCRSLHHLGIDVDADYTVSHTDSEAETLTTFINSADYFPALRKLTLYTLLGITRLPSASQDDLRMLDPLSVLKEHVPFMLMPDVGDIAGTPGPRTGKLDSIVANIGEQDRLMGIGRPAGWVTWERSNRFKMTLEREVDGQRNHLINASWTDGSSFVFERTPIAWMVERGNKWVETEYLEPPESVSRWR